ncbi:NADPH-dependent FMN reductase [Croceitalea rosinachiae]|uniref:NAD(P)H-dependent oxidoreductase n=1 Tax=Croceitalea rosinachiae TaxID=3075596 RepID=A0ABU3AC22_9FLAO|nr:NAD(P)H-dependent oxidoreductase [Croceitalea sp. F388]MDT0607721.1 NAD(P)H-dependent oxidoreductase [Croceitalea sp. F388]
MKKVLAIGCSNSKKSINTLFATYVANRMENTVVISLNWDNLILPLYSPDLEIEAGIPENAKYFKDLIQSADAIVLSLAEYNGLPTAAFKNLWDWTSRLDMKFWSNKPMFLMAVSPGGRGGANVLNIMVNLMPHFGGNMITKFSLPNFHTNFQNGELINGNLKEELNKKIQLFQNSI